MFKRKEIVIQWRKFGLKRSSTFRVMDFWSLCPFSDFYLIFINIFFTKITKKGLSNQVMTWWACPGGELTWCTGPPHGCDATLRPCGRAAGSHVRRRRRTGRWHVAGGNSCPHGSTWAPVWGATWQGVGRWRAHVSVGPSLVFGAVTQMRYRTPPFILVVSFILSRVGLCSHTVLTFCRWCGGTVSVG